MPGNPYEDMDEYEVLAIARKHLLKAAHLAPGSTGRSIAMAAYDSAMLELDRRLIAHLMARIQEEE